MAEEQFIKKHPAENRPRHVVDDFLQDGLDMLEKSNYDHITVALKPNGTRSGYTSAKVSGHNVENFRNILNQLLKQLEEANTGT